MSVVYQGQLHCELTHGPSWTKIATDAPKDKMAGARASRRRIADGVAG